MKPTINILLSVDVLLVLTITAIQCNSYLYFFPSFEFYLVLTA